MANPETQKKLAALGALVLPVIAVKTASIFLGGTGTLAAHAAAPAAATTPEAQKNVAKAAAPTARELAAAKYAESLRVEPFGPVPLLFAMPAVETSGHTETSTTPTPTPITIDAGPIPTFTLNAVMASGTGQRALINGRPYRQGDTVRETTWIVDHIESEKRSVTLRDSKSDRSLTITVEIPQ